jgi:hypothetical protein
LCTTHSRDLLRFPAYLGLTPITGDRWRAAVVLTIANGNIRRATIDELRAVLELWQQAEAEPTHTDDLQSLARLLDHDPSSLLVAATISAWSGRSSLPGTVGEVRSTDSWSRPIGNAAEMHLKSFGAVRLQAIVVASDVQATAFWRMSGWKE